MIYKSIDTTWKLKAPFIGFLQKCDNSYEVYGKLNDAKIW